MCAQDLRYAMFDDRVARIEILASGDMRRDQIGGGIKLVGAFVIDNDIGVEGEEFVADDGGDVFRVDTLAATIEGFKANIEAIGFGVAIQPVDDAFGIRKRKVMESDGGGCSGEGDADFLRAKVTTARFYAEALLPQAEAFAQSITGGSDAALALTADQF